MGEAGPDYRSTDGRDAVVLDECIHLMTRAFCSICKQQAADALRRRENKETGHPAFDTDDTDNLPYPHVVAQWDGICNSCDEPYANGTTIYRADGGWCCRPCAEDYKTLGVGTDG